MEYGSSLGTALVIDVKNNTRKYSVAIISWRVEDVFACNKVIFFKCHSCILIFILKILEGEHLWNFVYVVVQVINQLSVLLCFVSFFFFFLKKGM